LYGRAQIPAGEPPAVEADTAAGEPAEAGVARHLSFEA